MSTPQQADLTAALDRLWLQFRPQIEERLTTLEAAATALAANTLSSTQSSGATSAAHNLAGVLGTFSLPRGTDITRQLEQHFSHTPALESAPHLQSLIAELRSLIANRNN